jgi:hypothetical protein
MTPPPNAPEPDATMTFTLTLTPDEYDALGRLMSDGIDTCGKYAETWDGRRDEEVAFCRRAQNLGSHWSNVLDEQFAAQLPEVVKQRETEGQARMDAFMVDLNARIAAATEAE